MTPKRRVTWQATSHDGTSDPLSAANDPLGAGFVASLARPGGNITGLSMQNTDSASKRLELLREVVVGLRRLAILTNVSYGAAVAELREAHATARASGLEIITL